jgi:peptidoglycan/LPS O-acetylase OafA/YrhL
MSGFILEGWLLSRILPFHRMQQQKELERQRVVSLDGARGILALSVFFLHVVEFYKFKSTGLWVPTNSNFYDQMGVFPVTMFFFITGYVFWLKLIAQPRIQVRPFLVGRLGRLGGVYGFACLVCFALAAIVSGFQARVSLPRLIAQASGWLLFFGSGHDINKVYLSRLWLGPGWTLKFEWLFYLSIPLLGWFARRSQRLLIIVGLAAAFSFVVDHIHLVGPIHLLWEMLGSYAQFLAYTFSVGMLVACWRPTAKIQVWARSGVASCISILLLLVTLTWARPAYGWQESMLLAFPFASIAFGNTFFGLLTSQSVRFLGRISYSFYLLHMVLLTIEIMILNRYTQFAQVGPGTYWLFAAASGAIAILVSAISYQYLEYPLLHVGRSVRSNDRDLMSRPLGDIFETGVEPAA